MEPIAILVLVIVVVSIFVTILLLLLRLRNARRASNNDSSGGVPDRQRQGQQAAPGGWNQQAQARDNPWGQPAQQAGSWGIQGSSSPEQQPAWGSQLGSAAPQGPWTQAQPNQQSQQQGPTSYGTGSSPGPAWGQSPQPADPWGTPATTLHNIGPQGRLGVVRIEEGKEPGRVYEVRKDSLSIGRSRESDIFVE